MLPTEKRVPYGIINGAPWRIVNPQAGNDAHVQEHYPMRYAALAYLAYSIITDLAICGALTTFSERLRHEKIASKTQPARGESLRSGCGNSRRARHCGKSSTIRELTHYLPPDLYSVCLSHKPSKQAMASWLPTGKPNCRDKIASCFRSVMV